MDEILIGEQVYVSSKRAAQMTGYAKDYIGQLCREGRVEARLVGRNWYVREAAIKDHRFGEEASVKSENSPTKEIKEEGVPEKSKYASAEAPLIPEINDKKDLDTGAIGGEPVLVMVEEMQSAWKDWFTNSKSEEEVEIQEVKEDPPVVDTKVQEEVLPEQEGIQVPITRHIDMPKIEESAEEEPVILEERLILKHKKAYRRPYTLIAGLLILFIAASVGITSLMAGLVKVDATGSTADVILFLSGGEIYNK